MIHLLTIRLQLGFVTLPYQDFGLNTDGRMMYKFMCLLFLVIIQVQISTKVITKGILKVIIVVLNLLAL